MKNVTLDRTTVLQLDANGTDSALDAATDCHVLRNDDALGSGFIASLGAESLNRRCPNDY